ncbi:hypothetical protein, partial [Mesorhizobium sp. M0220]|uniref:hypothetical protein n=1 Tax=Mesorhizobium sp. M0220 TaxID=2956920 RepID=UPI003335D5A1
ESVIATSPPCHGRSPFRASAVLSPKLFAEPSGHYHVPPNHPAAYPTTSNITITAATPYQPPVHEIHRYSKYRAALGKPAISSILWPTVSWRATHLIP